MPKKVVELFAGIGAIRKALTRKGIKANYQCVEVDAGVVSAYNAIHNEQNLPCDVLDYHLEDESVDLLFHGSPCQDFSMAGKQAGGELGSNTRSSLLWRTIEIIDSAKVKPKIVIWENVKNVLSNTHKPVFDKYLKAMENLGYSNTYKVIGV